MILKFFGSILLIAVVSATAHADPSCEFDLTEPIPLERIDRAIRASRADHQDAPSASGAALMGVLGVPSARAVWVNQTVTYDHAFEGRVFKALRAVDQIFGRLIDARDNARAERRTAIRRERAAKRVTAVFERLGHLTDRARPVRGFVLSKQSWLTAEDQARLRAASNHHQVTAILRDRRDAWSTAVAEVTARSAKLGDRVREVLARAREVEPD